MKNFKIILLFFTFATSFANDFSSNNSKAIEKLYKRDGSGQLWNIPSQKSKAVKNACPDGFACQFCNITTIPCLNVSLYCLHQRTCTPSRGCEAPVCECADGWTTYKMEPGKLQCADDVDECSLGKCKNGGKCTNSPGSYRCECAEGWAGTDCDHPSSCALPTAKCGNNAECTMNSGYASCRCKATYRGNPYEGCFISDGPVAPQTSKTSRQQRAANDNTQFAQIAYDPYVVPFDVLCPVQEWMTGQCSIGHNYYTGLVYDGLCPTTFCRLDDSSVESEDFFKVVTINKPYSGLQTASVVKSAYFLMPYRQNQMVNVTFDYSWGMRALVQGELISHFPYSWPNNEPIFTIEVVSGPPISGAPMRLSTFFQLELYVLPLGDRLNVDLALPQIYAGRTRGLCGNMNGDACDDLQMPDGTQLPYTYCNKTATYADAATVARWGDSWVPENNRDFPYQSKQCQLGSGKRNNPEADEDAWAGSQTACKHLQDSNGVFQSCFPIVNGTLRSRLLAACKRDVIPFMNKPSLIDNNAICVQYLQPFAEACRSAEILTQGTSGLKWRQTAGCPAPTCGPNAHFSPVAPRCVNRCDDPFAQVTCQLADVQETCLCNSVGKNEQRIVFSDNLQECVKYPDGCSASRDGMTYLEREELVSSLCEETCVMVREGKTEKFSCNPIKQCAANSRCVAKDKRLDCHCEEGFIGDGRFECRKPQQNCADLQKYFGVKSSGISSVEIWGFDGATLPVYCDMITSGGGWTVVQRREDETSFNRSWTEYEAGFGSLNGSFWIGLEQLNLLTNNSRSPMTLRIDLEDCDGKSTFEEYKYVHVNDAKDGYRLQISDPSGTAGDALSPLNQMNANMMAFSTFDADHDTFPTSCAQMYGGSGWWFNQCTTSNLNGVYYPDCGGSGTLDTAMWFTGQDLPRCFKKIEMKVRPQVYPPTD